MQNYRDKIIVWTGQRSIVTDTIAREGRYVVKSRFVDQKYEESAWIFQTAYRAVMQLAAKRLERPEGAESPIWVYKEPTYIGTGEDIHFLKLEIPAEAVLLFDHRKWNKILNLSYIGKDEKEEEEFTEWLRGRGIRDSMDVFSSGFYPMEKRKVTDSWARLLDDEEIPNRYMQGMIWEIRREWIIEEK